MPKRRKSPLRRAENVITRGGQPGNDNARKHGFYAAPEGELTTIEGVVADVQKRQRQLSEYIDEALGAGNIKTADVLSLFSLHSQTASRLGRLLRDQRALSGKSANGLTDAIAAALDELSTELGIKL